MSVALSLYLDFKPNLEGDPIINTVLKKDPDLKNMRNLRVIMQKIVDKMVMQSKYIREEIVIAVAYSENPLEVVATARTQQLKGIGILNIPAMIYVPFWRFPFRGPDDPDVYNLEKVQKFSDKIAEEFVLTKRKVTYIDCHNLRMYLRFIQDPKNSENLKKAMYFGLYHEIGHIVYDHSSFEEKQSTLFKIVDTCLLKLPSLYYSRIHELEADRFSYSHSKEIAKGGIFLFQSIIDNYKDSSLINKMLNIFVRCGLWVTHTSCQNRILLIKQDSNFSS